jgi:putative (di)nucleoside polyphosphate hydrolase
MLDKRGFRLNVGIVLSNTEKKLFLGCRPGKCEAWQFPQGGIKRNETPKQAMYRELYEEIGLTLNQVTILAQTKNWLHYYIPDHLRRQNQKPFCIGQKQKWFLLRLTSDDSAINCDRTQLPEFSSWKWVDYWEPFYQIVDFKKEVYQNVLTEFETYL